MAHQDQRKPAPPTTEGQRNGTSDEPPAAEVPAAVPPQDVDESNRDECTGTVPDGDDARRRSDRCAAGQGAVGAGYRIDPDPRAPPAEPPE